VNSGAAWLDSYYIATYLLAVVAIAGFLWSIRSSRQAAEAAQRVQQALGAMVEPIIKVKEYTWNANGPTISCEHLPVQVTVGIRNFSTVPAQLYRTDFRTFFGEKELTGLVQNEQVHDDSPLILAPGEVLALSQVQPEEFPRHLAMLTGHPLFGPQFTINVEVEYSRVGSDRRWLYRTRQILLFDCMTPGVHQRRGLRETVEAIAATNDIAPTGLSDKLFTRLARWAAKRASAGSTDDI